LAEEEFYELAEDSNTMYDNSKIVTCEKFMDLNRYSNIVPMELSMVTTDSQSFNQKNYFNGNYITNRQGHVEFIATQGPLEETTEDFWNMVMMNRVTTIIGIHSF
jgi:protein tyrosine phosphatase